MQALTQRAALWADGRARGGRGSLHAPKVDPPGCRPVLSPDADGTGYQHSHSSGDGGSESEDVRTPSGALPVH